MTTLTFTKEQLIDLAEYQYDRFQSILNLLTKEYPPKNGCFYGVNAVGKIGQFVIQENED